MKKVVFVLLAVLTILSCNDDSSNLEVVNCTEEYVSIQLTVQFEDGTPVKVDYYKAMWGNKDITPVYLPYEYLLARKAGKYTIVNDEYKEELKGLSEFVTVTGYIGDTEIFEEEFLLGANECHVSYYGKKPLLITVKKDILNNIACTEVLMTIPLSVQYEDNSPVALDSYKVMWHDKDITPVKDFQSMDYQLNQKFGSYAIVNDSMKDELEGLAEEVTISGYIAGKEVFRRKILVGADRCHVTYLGTQPLLVTLKK